MESTPAQCAPGPMQPPPSPGPTILATPDLTSPDLAWALLSACHVASSSVNCQSTFQAWLGAASSERPPSSSVPRKEGLSPAWCLSHQGILCASFSWPKGGPESCPPPIRAEPKRPPHPRIRNLCRATELVGKDGYLHWPPSELL